LLLVWELAGYNAKLDGHSKRITDALDEPNAETQPEKQRRIVFANHRQHSKTGVRSDQNNLSDNNAILASNSGQVVNKDGREDDSSQVKSRHGHCKLSCTKSIFSKVLSSVQRVEAHDVKVLCCTQHIALDDAEKHLLLILC
jgi:hypothetical protein